MYPFLQQWGLQGFYEWERIMHACRQRNGDIGFRFLNNFLSKNKKELNV